MGLQLPKRARRVGLATAASSGLLLLGACSAADEAQIKRLALPTPATEQSQHVYDLWHGAWLAAIIVGVLVWGLILYAAFAFRRRHVDEVPVQTRYNLPIEILYTVAPIVIVLVLFYFTVTVQNVVVAKSSDTGGKPDHTLHVVGQQWSWTFNYVDDAALGGKTTVYEAGTTADRPTLMLPVGQSVEIKLTSPDVIHSFWVPAFLYKLDIIPGRENSFEITPTKEGTFAGRCAELCGTYHSRMLFNVEVVSPSKYADYLRQLQSKGQVGLVTGGSRATTQSGLEPNTNTSGGHQ